MVAIDDVWPTTSTHVLQGVLITVVVNGLSFRGLKYPRDSRLGIVAIIESTTAFVFLVVS